MAETASSTANGGAQDRIPTIEELIPPAREVRDLAWAALIVIEADHERYPFYQEAASGLIERLASKAHIVASDIQDIEGAPREAGR